MAKGKILVVDDQPGIRLLLHDVLTSEGYHVTTASTGAEAVEIIENDNFDLLVLDYRLPIMNAEKVIAEMEKLNREIPIILITGLANDGNEFGKLKYVKIVIEKPFNIQDICQEVNAILA